MSVEGPKSDEVRDKADRPLIAGATQHQTQRNLALREELLASQSFHTYESLAEQQDTTASSVRTWVSRLFDNGDVFLVPHQGTTLIPSVQLADDGQLNENIAKLVRIFRAAGIDGWPLWAWLCNPTGFLSGEIPAEVVVSNPERASRAAERSAAAHWRPDAEVS